MSSELQVESIKRELKKIKSQKPETKQLDLSDPVTFVMKHVAHPKGEPSEKWFEKREYLIPLYRDESRYIVIVKARQMEITEFAVNMLLYWALKRPGNYIYASSSLEKVRRFSKDRLMRQIKRSPDIKQYLLDADVHRVVLGESVIYLYTAYGQMDTLRSIPADAIILDEFQDMEVNALAVAEETLSHSTFKREWLIGTPKEAGSKFEELYNQSDKKEWKDGQWIPTHTPEQQIYSGYHISQMLAIGKWLTEQDIELKRKRFPKQKFLNEVLGEFYAGLGRPVNYQLMSSLFDVNLPRGKFNPKHEMLFAGVDWGVGRKAYTVFWLTKPVFVQPPDIYRFETIYVERIEFTDIIDHLNRVKQLCNQFPVKMLACDIGAGYLQNQELYKVLGTKMLNVRFVGSRPERPYEIIPTAFGNELQLDRTWAIDVTFDTIAKGNLKIYNEVDDSIRNWIIENFLAEYPETDPITKKKQWVHDPEQNDDALMAYLYSLMAFLSYKDTIKMENPSDYLSFV
jgi:hypothetical protein